MKFKIFLILILIFLIIYLFNNYNENYDGRIRNIKYIEDCADIASSIYGVSAFAYDDLSNNCYISKTSLTKPPIQIHPYHKNFKINDKICNKVNFILGEAHNSNQNNLIANRLYMCYNNNLQLDDNIDQIYFEKNKKAKIIKYEELSKLPFVQQKFFQIDYPTERRELNDIDIEYQINKEIKEIKNIKWEPSIVIKEPKKNPLNIYDDKNNPNLFKIKKNTCIDTFIFKKNNDLDKYYSEIK
jgi:hypothetical protein